MSHVQVAKDTTDKLDRHGFESQLFCMIMCNHFISFVCKSASGIAGSSMHRAVVF